MMVIGRTVDAHPGAAAPLKSATPTTQTLMANANKKVTRPILDCELVPFSSDRSFFTA
jgi:hypothetical protein